MTFLKRICKDRRGMAMEMAMLVMVVTFALGTLMVTVALMQNNSVSAIERDFNEKLELEQIGENFCKRIEAQTKGETPDFEGMLSENLEKKYDYDVDADVDAFDLFVRDVNTDDILMTVGVKKVGEAYEIVKWEIK